MIRLDGSPCEISPRAKYGLDVLLELSRLALLAPGVSVPRAVRLEVVPGSEHDAAGDAPPGPDAFSARDGVVEVTRPTLEWIARVAGAADEQHEPRTDRLGRVPSSANVAVRSGLERTPIVSELAQRFFESVRSLALAAGRPFRRYPAWPAGKTWAACFTHDLDGVALWPLFNGVRIADGLKRRNAKLAATAAAGLIKNWGRDPLGDGARALLEMHRSCGTKSSWFVLCGSPTPRTVIRGDLTYVPESRPVRRLLDAIRSDGHEVGLHGSFETFEDPRRFAVQRARLERIVHQSVEGVRQHFLRMSPGRTQAGMKDAGFTYDATFGFPDRNGHRLGVAEVVPGWDDARGRLSGLDEVPFAWMDRSLSKYRGIEEPAAWIADALELSGGVRAVGGLFVCIWHPHLTNALGYEGAFTAYGELVHGLLTNGPYCASVGEVVAWRRALRTIRIHEVTSDGRAAARGSGWTGGDVALIDQEERPREGVTWEGAARRGA